MVLVFVVRGVVEDDDVVCRTQVRSKQHQRGDEEEDIGIVLRLPTLLTASPRADVVVVVIVGRPFRLLLRKHTNIL